MKKEKKEKNKKPENVQKISLHNRFDIEVRSCKGKVKKKAFAENIILDGAWGQILHSAVGVDWFDKIAYGTGTGAMSAGRTALFTPLGEAVATDSEFVLNNEDNYISHRQKITILENQHVGAQLSEVGIKSETGTLCTHAMIKDMNGNPVVITKTDTDIIIIYATVYLLFNTTYSPTATLDILRVDPATNQIASNLLGRRVFGSSKEFKTAWRHRILISRGSENAYYKNVDYLSDPFNASLDPAQKTARIYYRIPAAVANIGGFMSAVVGSVYDSVSSQGCNSIITRFAPGGVTQSPVVEQIGTGDGETTDFATSFAQIPSNTVIKVDGIVASPTIYANMPNHNNIRNFFRKIDTDHPEYKNTYFDLFGVALANGTYTIFEKMHPGCLLEQTYTRNTEISVSDDTATWTVLGTTASSSYETFDVPVAHQQKRYWRFTNGPNSNTYVISSFYQNSATDFKNVRFATAPASGAVITAEYTPNCAAKDANHVLDIDITIQLAEHVD